MVNPELLRYIVREEHEGFSREVIEQALRTHGYSAGQVQRAFQDLENGHQDDEIHRYVQEYARQGQTPGQTFSMLHEQGYEPANIRTSIHAVYGQPEGRTHTIVFTLAALVIGAAGMWLMLSVSGPDELSTPQFSPSEHIAFAIEDVRAGKDGISSCRENLEGIHLEKCYAVIAAATDDSTICSSIQSDDLHDSCLMSFIDIEFDSVCGMVKLQKNKQTCQSIRSLQV